MSKYIVEGVKIQDTTYSVLRPNPKVNREARFIYTKRFTEALKDGFLTKKKLEAILKGTEGGIDVLANHVARRAEILEQYAKTLQDAEASELPEELERYASLLAIYRNQLTEEDISINSLFQNTAEQIADDDEINFLVSELTVDNKGNRFWEDLTAFMEDDRAELIESAKYQVMCYKYGINSKETFDTAEFKFRKKAETIRRDEDTSNQGAFETSKIRVPKVSKSKSTPKSKKKVKTV